MTSPRPSCGLLICTVTLTQPAHTHRPLLCGAQNRTLDVQRGVLSADDFATRQRRTSYAPRGRTAREPLLACIKHLWNTITFLRWYPEGHVTPTIGPGVPQWTWTEQRCEAATCTLHEHSSTLGTDKHSFVVPDPCHSRMEAAVPHTVKELSASQPAVHPAVRPQPEVCTTCLQL
jgi:hypothetical protein